MLLCLPCASVLCGVPPVRCVGALFVLILSVALAQQVHVDTSISVGTIIIIVVVVCVVLFCCGGFGQWGHDRRSEGEERRRGGRWAMHKCEDTDAHRACPMLCVCAVCQATTVTPDALSSSKTVWTDPDGQARPVPRDGTSIFVSLSTRSDHSDTRHTTQACSSAALPGRSQPSHISSATRPRAWPSSKLFSVRSCPFACKYTSLINPYSNSIQQKHCHHRRLEHCNCKQLAFPSPRARERTRRTLFIVLI